jgi:ubiquinone/menaquinone biosynthesis C-methylase UbiE
MILSIFATFYLSQRVAGTGIKHQIQTARQIERMSEGNNQMSVDPKATNQTQTRYQRIAPLYDGMEVLAERQYRHWRVGLWSMVRGPKVLEVGVGTGKNMPYYPTDVDITAIDLTPGMLNRARKRAARLSIDVDLRFGDVQSLDLPDSTFDDVVETFVFCSVPDPLLGLEELARVVKPGGRVFMLEHVRSENPFLGPLMDALNPVVVRITGVNINRKTVENVSRSGLRLEKVEDLGKAGVFKLIVARRES